MNIKQIYIQEYINEIKDVAQFALDTYLSCRQICAEQSNDIFKNYQKIKSKYGLAEDFVIDKLITQSERNKIVEYIQLSCQLQGLCTLWEHRLLCFFKASERWQALNKMKNSFGFDFNDDFLLKEIWNVYNVLKHGKRGKAGKELKEINSNYLSKSSYFDEIANNKEIVILNISEKDIEYFTEQIVRFWEIIITKLPQKR